MVVPNKYVTLAEPAIATYNFIDIAEGSGVVQFYGGRSDEAGTPDYHLITDSSFYSDGIKTQVNLSGAVSDAKQLDLDFDVQFNLPKVIKGNVYVTATLGCTSRNAGTTTTYFIAKVRKWNGTSETEIASATSRDVVITDAVGAETLTLRIPISSVQNFKAGETLRITMEIWAEQSGGSSNLAVWHDPVGRTETTASVFGTDDTSIMKFYIPFVLDI